MVTSMDCTEHDNGHFVWPGGTSSHVDAAAFLLRDDTYSPRRACHHATEGITYRDLSRDATEVDGAGCSQQIRDVKSNKCVNIVLIWII